jgi:hypothetical protein
VETAEGADDRMTILSAGRWLTNGDLVADVAAMPYWPKPDRVCDPTFGGGVWWTKYTPDLLFAFDRVTSPTFDFRAIPLEGESVDVVAFDPPYVAKGGRKTSTIDEMDERYGLRDCPSSPLALQALINDGMTEGLRILAPGGILLTKVMSYVSGGTIHWGYDQTTAHAQEIGLRKIDEFIHVGHPGPQPGGRRQVHARRNQSYLLVFWKQNGKRCPW